MKKINKFILKVLKISKILFVFLAITFITSVIWFLILSRFVKFPKDWIVILLMGLATSIALILNRKRLDKVAKAIIDFSKQYYRAIALIFILSGVWFGFIRLVKKPPLDTTSVMIMVWVTAVILILALFPSILNNLKKVKVGNVEIELQESIQSSTTENFVSVSDLRLDDARYFLGSKGGPEELFRILRRMYIDRKQPVLLTVNLRSGISKAFLFVYLFLMEKVGNLVIILFTNSSNNIREFQRLEKNDIVGVISGNNLIKEYYRRFPLLAYELRGENQRIFNDGLNDLTTVLSERDIMRFLEQCYETIDRQQRRDAERTERNQQLERGDRLSLSEVDVWLSNSLNKGFVDSSLTKADLESIIRSLMAGDDFLIVTEEKSIKTILVLEKFNRNISNKVLIQLATKK
jgi:hypothetical protein